MLLAAALLPFGLPALLWDRPVDTAPKLKSVGVTEIAVPAEKAAGWRAAGFSVREIPGAACLAVPAPKVNMRANVARATSSPWVDSNSWRFLRNPDRKFCIDAPGKSAGLAAAEAFAYGVDAYIRTDDEGVAAFGAMTKVLQGAYDGRIADVPVADIGVVDDGSASTGEMLNLLSRRNLLYRVLKAPDASLKINVSGTDREHDPSKEAYGVRQKLGDDRRSVRVYGSEVVIAHLAMHEGRLRVHLINYAQRPVNGLRVRVAGLYSKAELRGSGLSQQELADMVQADGGTEFTVASINDYALVELGR